MNKKPLDAFLYLIFSVYLFVFFIFTRLFSGGFIFPTAKSYNVFIIIFYFFYALSVIIFFLINLKNDKWKTHIDFLLFNIVFCYSLFWIKQGLDLTDEGFTISKSYFILNGLWKENIDFIWATTLINGLWLKLIGSPMIIWERVGYTLLVSFIALTSYKILKNYFDGLFCALAVFASIIFVRMNIQTINYNILPGFFILLSILFLLKALEDKTAENKTKTLFLFLSGTLAGFSIFTRFTNLSYIFVFFLFFVLYFFIKKEKARAKYFLINFSGVFSGILAGLAILILTKSFSVYIKNITYMFFDVLIKGTNQVGQSVTTETHSFTDLFSGYLKNFKMIFYYFFLFTAFPAALILFIRKTKNIKTALILKYILYLSIMISYFYLFRRYYDKRILLSAIMLNLTILLFSKIDLKKYFFLIFWALILPVFNALGSDIFFDNFFTSGGIVLLFASSLCALHKTKLQTKTNPLNLKNFAFIILFFIILTGGYRQLKTVYRDILFLDKNNALSESRILAGIRTSRPRKKAVEGLLNYFKSKEDFNGETLLCVNSQPMLYTLLEHKYFFHSQWSPWIFLEDHAYLSYEVDILKKNNKLPGYLVFPPLDARQPLWPATESKCRSSDIKQYELFYELSRSDFYNLVFTNRGYEVYKLKK